MARGQYKAVYRLYIVVAGHGISDIKQKWETVSGEEPSVGAHLHGIIPSARSTGLSEQSSSDQLGKTESATKPCL